MKNEILKTELQNEQYADLVDSQDYQAIANQLNYQPLILNPLPQGKVWKCPEMLDLFGALTPGEALELYKIPNLVSDIRLSVDLRSKDNLMAYLMIVQGLISAESASKIQVLLEATEDDPGYQQYIKGESRSQQLGIYPVSSFEVQGVLN
jgi:hypothetical protein